MGYSLFSINNQLIMMVISRQPIKQVTKYGNQQMYLSDKGLILLWFKVPVLLFPVHQISPPS